MKTIILKWVVEDKEVNEANLSLDFALEGTSVNEYYMYEWDYRDSTRQEVQSYKKYLKDMKG